MLLQSRGKEVRTITWTTLKRWNMYSYEQMIKAVTLYIKLEKRTALTIQTLGYPTKNTLKGWFKTYQLQGDLPRGYQRKKTLFSVEQKTNAINHYLENGCSMTYTIRCLGYPCRSTLRKWLRERHPNLFKSEGNHPLN